MNKQINKFNKFFDDKKLKNNLQIIRSYINILKKSNLYIDKIALMNDEDVTNSKSYTIDSAINYFIILHNFLIIEKKFFNDVKMSNKEINKYLDLKKLDNIDDIIKLFYELYDPYSKIRFALETFDSIESIRIYLKTIKFKNKYKTIYNTLLKNEKS